MAFSNSPELQSYTTKRVPLAWPLRIRANNNNTDTTATVQGQGEGMVNLLPRKQRGEEEITGITRPALNAIYISSPLVTGTVRGFYVWEKTPGQSYSFIVVDDSVYSAVDIEQPANFSGSNWVLISTLTSGGTSPVRFTEYIDDTNTKKLVLATGTQCIVYTSNVAGTFAVGFPNPHIPFPVFLNGRIFLAAEATGDIYNSNLNDPNTWTPGDFISTEVYPDDVRALLKVNNYVLAIGAQGSEFFYDAANASGSPLARLEGGILPFGCIFPNSIATTKDQVVMLAQTNEGQSHFVGIDGLQAAPIVSDGVVSMYQQALSNPGAGISDLSDAAKNCRGFFFRSDGELYYTFLFDGVRGSVFQRPNIDFSFTYSFGAKCWTELQYGSDTTDRKNRWAFPVKHSHTSVTGQVSTFVAGNAGTTGMAFFGVLRTNSGVDSIVPLTPHNIYQELRIPNQDFETTNRKMLHRCSLVVETGSSDVNPEFAVRWNDKDFNSLYWQGPVSFGTGTEEYFPSVFQLGQFRRRGFMFYTASGKSITVKYAEFDINRGIQ